MSSKAAEAPIEPALCDCGVKGIPPGTTGTMRNAFGRSPLTGYWYHAPCGKPTRAWWEGQRDRIMATTGDP